MSIHETAERLEAGRLIAIVRVKTDADLPAIARAILDGGISSIEFTLNSPGALDAIGACVKSLGKAALIGAGTVLRPEDVWKAAEARAAFVVSPIADQSMIAAAQRSGCAILPGAYTPTEIALAHAWGGNLIKLFPAKGLGPSYVREVLAPLEHIKLVPTGGVTPENAAMFLNAGAAALAVGSSVCRPEWVAARDYAAITRAALALRAAVDAWEKGWTP
jgi:2-dehydro-3-deoxyphosphogluconate aldolase/(4S)-4-hydroxy-2-oxoglutarate aldolase